MPALQGQPPNAVQFTPVASHWPTIALKLTEIDDQLLQWVLVWPPLTVAMVPMMVVPVNTLRWPMGVVRPFSVYPMATLGLTVNAAQSVATRALSVIRIHTPPSRLKVCDGEVVGSESQALKLVPRPASAASALQMALPPAIPPKLGLTCAEVTKANRPVTQAPLGVHTDLASEAQSLLPKHCVVQAGDTPLQR